MDQLETGDLFRAAYLVSRGGRVARVYMEGAGHVVLLLEGEALGQEDQRYRKAAGLVVSGHLKIDQVWALQNRPPQPVEI